MLSSGSKAVSNSLLARAAELLDSIYTPDGLTSSSDHDDDSSMQGNDHAPTSNPILTAHNEDPAEAALEAREAHKYLLAKSYFDTREYDRCAAVFLPLPTSSKGLAAFDQKSRGPAPTTPLKPSGKAESTPKKPATNPFPKLSQKSLFLSLYARYLSGEKRRDEETEMVLGPAEQGVTVNRELAGLARSLEGYFLERRDDGLEDRNQGWLEYLYGVILAKSKNEEEAKYWLMQSVHRAPFHWGAWRELNDLLADAKEVGILIENDLVKLTASAGAANLPAATPEYCHLDISPLQLSRALPDNS